MTQPRRTCCPHATVIFLVLDQRNVWRFVSSSDPCLRRLAIPAVKASDRLLGLVGENLAKGIRSTLSHPNGSGSRLCGPQGQRLPDGTGGGFAGRPDGLCRSSLHGDSVMSDARHTPGFPGCIARFRRHSCERPVRSAGSACTALLAPTRRSPEPGSGVLQLHNKETT